MFRGLFWLCAGIFNVYIASILMNHKQQDISLLVALYCGIMAVVYFYFAARPK